MKLLLVFNPNAHQGRAASLLPDLLASLESFAEVDVLRTRCRGDAMQRLAETALNGYDSVVVAGGDGTLFETVNGLYVHPQAERPPLAVLPVGTGNAFARELNLGPGDWRQGVEIIRRGQTRNVDVGWVECADEHFHFINIVGAGLPAETLQVAARMRIAGRAAYNIATLWQALRMQTWNLKYQLDGVPCDEESLFIEVCNSRYTGSSFLIAPDAQMDDGLFDIVSVQRMSRARLLRLFPSIYSGTHVHYPEVRIQRAEAVHIEAPAGMLLAPDGELRGATPVTIRCLQRDLELYGA